MGDEDEDDFVNYYSCPKCGHEWTDVWSAQSDDDCPNCGTRHITPYFSEDADDEGENEEEREAVLARLKEERAHDAADT